MEAAQIGRARGIILLFLLKSEKKRLETGVHLLGAGISQGNRAGPE